MGKLALVRIRQLCTKCGKDYCICNIPWTIQGELHNIHKKLDIIITILNRRKSERNS
jgi:hypothetical protein